MVDSATANLRAAVVAFASSFDPATIEVGTAKAMVRDWAAIENTAATIKAMAAARVARADRWDRIDGKSAADWLAAETGTTAPKAQQQISTGARLAELDATAAAARRGELSPEQAVAIADAAAVDPSAESALLRVARSGSLRDLRELCATAKARADTDPEATRQRIHAARRLREWTDAEGVGHLHASGPPDALARVHVGLGPITDRRFREARREGRVEDPAAYAFDALVDLAGDARVGSKDTDRRRSSVPTRFRAVIRVDHEALVRGSVEGEETCEIAGVGPIPVSTARELLGEATLHLVVTKGVDVANVTYLGRAPNAAQRIALLWQMPMCAVADCPRRAHLQHDHSTPWASCHTTILGNLQELCGQHHHLKTHRGWELVAGQGRRAMVGPEHPEHPKNRRRPTAEDAAA